MIWSIDQDDSENTSTDNLLGIGTSNGVSQELGREIKSGIISADEAAQVANSCYWSFCGGDCTSGFYGTTQARGVVGSIRLLRRGRRTCGATGIIALLEAMLIAVPGPCLEKHH